MDSVPLQAAWQAALQDASASQLAVVLKLLMRCIGVGRPGSAAGWVSQATAEAFQVGILQPPVLDGMG